MSDKPETLAAILAEMRGAAKSTDLFNGEEVGEPLIRGTKVEEWADRIEAAAERERNAHTNDIHNALYMAAGIPGNAAALREALEEARKFLLTNKHGYFESRLIPQIEAALAAPARNCDVGTAKEQKERFKAFCEERDCYKCPFYGHSDCSFEWALAPFAPEKGGAE